MAAPSPTVLLTRPQVRSTCKQIFQYAHARGLEAGGQLPSTEVLVEQLQVCRSTLQNAMDVLAASGVVNRRQKRGTIMQRMEPGPLGPKVFTVGVIANASDATPFSFVFQKTIREELHIHGCDDRTYLYMRPSSPEDPYRLSLIPHLKDDVEAGFLDAVIQPASHALDLDVPVFAVGYHLHRPWGLILDRPRLVADALRLLCLAGCQRPLVIYTAAYLAHKRHLDVQEVTAAMREGGVEPSPDNHRIINARDPIEGVFAVLQSSRADGIVITDDHIAQHVAQYLRNRGESPLLVVQTNKQIPLVFALPVVRLEWDVVGYAKRAVEMVVEYVLGIKRNSGLERMSPHLCLKDAPEAVVSRIGKVETGVLQEV